jgi:hypothetical protein
MDEVVEWMEGDTDVIDRMMAYMGALPVREVLQKYVRVHPEDRDAALLARGSRAECLAGVTCRQWTFMGGGDKQSAALAKGASFTAEECEDLRHAIGSVIHCTWSMAGKPSPTDAPPCLDEVLVEDILTRGRGVDPEWDEALWSRAVKAQSLTGITCWEWRNFPSDLRQVLLEGNGHSAEECEYLIRAIAQAMGSYMQA